MIKYAWNIINESINNLDMIMDNLGINWDKVKFTKSDLLKGYKVEKEHGLKDPKTDITHDDPIETMKIAWAHLNERPDYYIKLDKMEKTKIQKGK